MIDKKLSTSKLKKSNSIRLPRPSGHPYHDVNPVYHLSSAHTTSKLLYISSES